MTRDTILVLNAGSSSLKVSLFEAREQLPLVAHGRITGIGAQPALLWQGALMRELPHKLNQAGALGEMLAWIGSREDAGRLCCAGHRIVHGGDKFSAPLRLTPAALAELEALIPLAPLHQPSNLSAIRTLGELHPELPQVGCFDTAFHAQHRPLFRHFALPKALRDRGLRRYGFHGLSYEWIARVLKTEHPQIAAGRVVAAHLGSGASLCALDDGKSIDTTMGLTPLDGLPMGTRCGNLDPGVILYLLRELGWNADQIERTLSSQSGLVGLSGISSDIRELLASDSPDAQFAVDFFTVMTAQHVARMAVSLGGLDALVFTGGIGEHAAPVRAAIQNHLGFLPPFKVLVIPANEERMIAEHCWKLLP